MPRKIKNTDTEPIELEKPKKKVEPKKNKVKIVNDEIVEDNEPVLNEVKKKITKKHILVEPVEKIKNVEENDNQTFMLLKDKWSKLCGEINELHKQLEKIEIERADIIKDMNEIIKKTIPKTNSLFDFNENKKTTVLNSGGCVSNIESTDSDNSKSESESESESETIKKNKVIKKKVFKQPKSSDNSSASDSD